MIFPLINEVKILIITGQNNILHLFDEILSRCCREYNLIVVSVCLYSYKSSMLLEYAPVFYIRVTLPASCLSPTPPTVSTLSYSCF